MGLLKKIGSKIGGVLGRVGNWIYNNAGKVGGVIGTVGNMIGGPYGGVIKGIGGVLGAIPGVVKTIKGRTENIKDLGQTLKQDINDNIRNIKDIYNQSKIS